MVKKYYMIQLILAILISSCSHKVIPDYLVERFTYCYDGNDTKIDSLLNINGYYVIAESFNDFGYNSTDTSYFNILFYNNGLCVVNFFPFDNKGRILDNKFIPAFFNTIVNDSKSNEAYLFYNSRKWGRYVVDSDIVKIQCIYKPQKGETTRIWNIDEVWYKIVNYTTLIEINPTSVSDLYIKNNYLPAQFIPLIEKPIPDCWLLKENWFYCNKNK